MPIYEYACSTCGKINDVLQKVNDPAPEACVECSSKGTLSKVVSRSSFVLKGGGWYSDLYSSTKKEGGSSGAASSSSKTSSDSGSTASSSTSAGSTSGSGGSGSGPKMAAAAHD